MCITLKKLLGKNITEPPGLPDSFLQFSNSLMYSLQHLILMYKKKQLLNFVKTTNLRLIIASTAFGLGIDCKDIMRVINYGTPNTLEELVQEIGRAERNGKSITVQGLLIL